MALHRASLRPLLWVRSTKRDYQKFPPQVQDGFGFALFLVQKGQHPFGAKALKGLGSGAIELVEDHDGDTFRVIYTVRFPEAIYVLHAFKKKSKTGSKTPRSDIDLVRRRLKDAEEDYAAHLKRDRRP